MFQRSSLIAAAGLLVLASAGQAAAAPCRDAKGHFAACPALPVAKASGPCRTAAGQFVSCSAAPAAGAAAPAPKAMAATTRSPPRARTGAASNATAVAPAAPAVAGAVTARCRDGSVSRSAHRSGTCSRHGGVAAWM